MRLLSLSLSLSLSLNALNYFQDSCSGGQFIQGKRFLIYLSRPKTALPDQIMVKTEKHKNSKLTEYEILGQHIVFQRGSFFYCYLVNLVFNKKENKTGCMLT